MTRLHVQAAIHPTSIASVLVLVEDADGSNVELFASDFDVKFWASNTTAPGDSARYYPSVVSVISHSLGHYELLLDDERYNEDNSIETWHEPLPSGLENVVYVVTVQSTTPIARGSCIARQPDI